MASKSDSEINFEPTLRQHIKNSGAAKVAVCNRFAPDEANAYLEHAMDAAALSAYETHLADCSICRRHIIELARLMPQPETKSVTAIAAENAAPNFLSNLRQWFSGWRLGALAGLGAATAALILFFANVQFSSREAKVAVTETNIENPSPLRGAESPKEQIAAPPNAPAKDATEAELSRSGASPADVAKLTELATKKSAESNLKMDAASAESTSAAPPPPPPMAAPGIAEAPKREAMANNVGQTQSQISSSDWQRVTPTPTPRGPALNQMQADRAMAIKQAQPTEEKAEKDKTNALAAAPKPAQAMLPRSDDLRNEQISEREKRSEPVRAKEKSAAAKASAPAKAAPPAALSVAGKEFRRVNGIWTDTNYEAANHSSVVSVKFNSEAYQQILAATPALKPYFALQTVIVVWQGKAYRVEK